MSRSSSTTASYRQRLKAVGGVLDARGYHAMVILEVEGGLLVRASRDGSRHPEILEFVDGAALPGDGQATGFEVRRRLFPGGYAPFLEVLGERLDQSSATSVSIVEGTDFVTVSGFTPLRLADDEVIYEALDLLLLAEEIARLVEQGPGSMMAPPAPSASSPVFETQRSQPRVASRLTSATSSSLSRMIGAVRPQTLRARG